MRVHDGTLAALCGLLLSGAAGARDTKVVKYARFQAGDAVAYGIVEGDTVHELDGDLFGKWRKTDRTHRLSDVKLLAPCRPTQVLAMAGNYKSHLGGDDVVTTVTTTTRVVTGKGGDTTHDSKTTVDVARPGVIPEKFKIPQPFFKSPSCLIANGEDIVLPSGSKDVHYEAELVIVIGKKAKDVPEDRALEHVLGVTCGNDVSARDWQKADVQWWRAKGSDTFGPVGPVITSGINYDDLRLQLRLNGKTMQDTRTRDFIQSVPKMVSFVSKHVTLHPGDLIFTGTPGTTTAMKAGDVVEVELEGVGILKNGVVAGK